MFEHLDDPAPPEADGDVRHVVAHREDALRRRRHSIPTAIIGVLFLAAAVGVVAKTMQPNDENKSPSLAIRVRRPTGTIVMPDVRGEQRAAAMTQLNQLGLPVQVRVVVSNTVADGAVVSQSPAAGGAVPHGSTVRIVVSSGPYGLNAHLELASNTIAAGGTLHGTLVVRNNTDHALDLRVHGCKPQWTVEISRPGSWSTAAFRGVCITGPWHVPAGTSSYPFAVRASLTQCGGQPSTIPRCLPNGGMPPLPVGKYQAVFVLDGEIAGFPLPASIPVTIG
jgi:hypothetical protein